MRFSFLLMILLFGIYLNATENESPVWTFVKVKLKGSLVGKDRFLQAYLFEPGDQFDESKHTHALKKIEQSLKDEGFLRGRMEDAFTYDKKNKTVTVTLTLHSGPKYTINDVQVELLNGEDVPFLSELSKKIERSLQKKVFMKELVDQQAQEIRSFLLEEGYVRPKISLTSKQDDTKNTVDVKFTIKLEAKRVFAFTGNTFFSQEALIQEILVLEKEGISLLPTLIAEEIEMLYKQKGFFNVTVQALEKAGKILFTIKEGSRVSFDRTKRDALRVKIQVRLDDEKRVRSIDPAVDSIIQKTSRDIIASGYYDEEIINQVLNRTSALLSELGFWDVTIDKDIHAQRMLILITLGDQRLIKDIAVRDYPQILNEPLFKSYQALEKPIPLHRQLLAEQRRWLLDYFKQQGYLHTYVDFELEPLDTGLRLVWKIDTRGGPVRFGPTTIVGLQKIKPHVILRERAYQEGDVWNPECIEETIKRLRALSMFESVSIVPVLGNDVIQPLVIKLVEDDPFEIRTRFGVQFVSKSFTHLSWTTFKVGGSFIWKNPAGIADRFWADFDFTRYSRNIAVNYEVPWIGSWPLRTHIRAYSDRFDQPFVSNNQRLYKEAHDGFSVIFHHNHTWWYGCVKTGFELNKLSGISAQAAREIQFEPALVNQRTPYFYIEPSFTFERLDDKNDPVKGFLTNFSFRAMVPIGVKDGWFIRAVLEQSFFYPLVRNIVGAVHWRVGHIFNAKFSTILPTERFYLGGSCSLRGYETNMVPPLNDLKCNSSCFWVPVGGKSMANINAELRFPIYNRFSGVIFTDVGILTQDRFADIAANRWFGATGFGLRIATPVAPIRFDIGWKWRKRDANDKSYAWFLTLGHAF